MDVPVLRRRLLRWYRSNRRDLPWRRTSDPYAVWISEVMLQQTRVDTATGYYARWMQRFPTVAALAAANGEDVMRAWSGLGYYSRARNLHAAARIVVAEHAGRVPTDAAELATLPGVGPYTAAAVASIAGGQPVAVVDGNVERVVARLACLRGAAKAGPQARRIRDLAAAWLAPRNAGDWNQAMMELGATLCTPRAPQCGRCPVAALCAARAAGMQSAIPPPARRSKPRIERPRFAVVRWPGASQRVLLVRNPPAGLLAGMWALPGGTGRRPLAELVHEQTGVDVELDSMRATSARHEFSHRTWEMTVYQARPRTTGGPAPQAPHPRGRREARWMAVGALHAEAVPTATRVALAAVGLGVGRNGAGDARAGPARRGVAPKAKLAPVSAGTA